MVLKWTIIKLENNKFFYFKEKAGYKTTWTSDPKNAKLFDTTGGAEYYATNNGLKTLGIKRIEI